MTGRPLADAAHARALFGCEEVKNRLHVLVGLAPEEMARQDATAVGHLGWCTVCRERLAELIRVETAVERGAFEPAAAPRAAPEPFARLVIALRAGLARFAEVPYPFGVPRG